MTLAITSLRDTTDRLDAFLLVGLPDGDPEAARDLLDQLQGSGLPVCCTNPDSASPRAGRMTMVSPVALAHDAAKTGLDVIFYGKPHYPVLTGVTAALGVASAGLLMVGRCREYDIAGGYAAGWATAVVQGGLHATLFANGVDVLQTDAALGQPERGTMPSYTPVQSR